MSAPPSLLVHQDSLSSSAECTFKLVKDAVIFVQVAQLLTEMFVDIDSLDWLVLHGNIPNLERKVITRQDVFAIFGEFDIRDGRNDFGKE
jgi:hypothetical protein